eukprot:2768775-Ditylum_brightwellii.AAC.1
MAHEINNGISDKDGAFHHKRTVGQRLIRGSTTKKEARQNSSKPSKTVKKSEKAKILRSTRQMTRMTRRTVYQSRI